MTLGSVETVDQLAGFDAETIGQPEDRRQPRLATAALDPADRGRMHSRGIGEAVLRDTLTRSKLAHPVAESSACAVGVVVERCGHVGSVAAPSRSDQSVSVGSAMV